MKHKTACILPLLLTVLLLSGCVADHPTLSASQTAQTVQTTISTTAVTATTTATTAPPPAPEPLWDGDAEAVRAILLNEGTDTVYESTDVLDAFTLQQRYYARANGDEVLMARAQSRGGQWCLKEWSFASDGLICWYDRAAACWKQLPLEEGIYNASMIELALDDSTSCLLYTPKTYTVRENESLEYLPAYDGYLELLQTGDGWTARIHGCAPQENCVSDYMLLRASEPLLDWSHRNCGLLWKEYMLDTQSRWCFDGYYFPTPHNYVPTGENYFYRCPAGYFIKSMAYMSQIHRAAEDLAITMLDTMAMHQNADGFWATMPASEWLQEDFGIAGGFYDTRFNTELAELYLKVYTDHGGDRFGQALDAYVSYFTDYARSHHFETANGGWLVQDYAHPDGNDPTHASLNHHIAECILLYRLAQALARPELAELADHMLLGIADTQDDWIRDDGDLHYAYMPDASFGVQDYPYLTYNDLLHLQQELTSMGRQPSQALAVLMDAKRAWMDQNGITAYER